MVSEIVKRVAFELWRRVEGNGQFSRDEFDVACGQSNIWATKLFEDAGVAVVTALVAVIDLCPTYHEPQFDDIGMQESDDGDWLTVTDMLELTR